MPYEFGWKSTSVRVFLTSENASEHMPLMKLMNRIIVLWVPQVLLFVAARIIATGEETAIAPVLISMVSSLLGVVCFMLFKKEVHKRTRIVFLNLALFFEANALVAPLFEIMNVLVFELDEAQNYLYQYQGLMYYLLLSLSPTFLVLDGVSKWHRMSTKYTLTVLIAVGGWLVIFYPYLENPDYLKSTPQIANYKRIRDVITDLKKTGITDPSAAQIVSFEQLKSAEGIKDDVGSNLEGRLKVVLEILPYTRGEDYATLYWKPLHLDCMWISVLCISFLIASMVFNYVKDPPEGAYVEKIIWCLLVFCAFEALHMYAFAQTTRWETLLGVISLGQYVSLVTMVILLFLLAMRIRFVHTIEGSYYERRLLSDPSRITRWRDALDNWVLKQFMNPGELDRRFLTQRKTEE